MVRKKARVVVLAVALGLAWTSVSWADTDPEPEKQKRIGLALSGGGYRAAAFHLGVMQKLDELEILDEVDRMSCVSGGSIAGAVVALHWKEANRLDFLEDFLRTRSIAVSSVLKGVFNPFKSRVEALASAYDRHLFDKKTLDVLQETLSPGLEGPELYLNATNLATGNLFSFVVAAPKMPDGEPSALDGVKMKDHGVEVSAKGFSIAKAVAASSAFPPVYNPLKLDQEQFKSKSIDSEYQSLTDGGVYDNLGINPLVVSGEGASDYVIISDAGMPLRSKRTPTRSSVKVLKDALAISKDQVGRLQIKDAQTKKRRALWFAIDSQVKQGHPGDEKETVKVGTNLKALSDEEMTVLTRHGAALVQKRICQFAPELIRTEALRRSTCPRVDKILDYLESLGGKSASLEAIAENAGGRVRAVKFLLERLLEVKQVEKTEQGKYFVPTR